jgi:phenylacetate-CoA ligase
MAWIHNSVLLPLAEPERHRGLSRRLKAIERFDRLSREEQLERQQTHVRSLLEHAYQTTPYYRRIFDEAGFRACDWSSGQPLPLPELSRDLLRAHEEELKSRKYPEARLRRALTGGTTSTPVAIWRDVEALRNKTAMQFHLNRLVGYDQGTSVLYVWGAERDIELNPGWKWRLYEQGLLRRQTIAAGHVTREVMDRFVQKLNAQKPDILYGYSATTARFAEHLRTVKTSYHRPRRIIVTAEPLSSADREILESTFECPVTEHYGSRDVGMVAHQCDEGQRYHFHPLSCFIELVHCGQTADGPLYRLMVTDLLNYGMPLIRYDTGDCVTYDRKPCSCGSWQPSTTAILGRAVDHFVLPDGSLIPGVVVSLMMGKNTSTFRFVRQVQLIQKTTSQMHMRYAAENGDLQAIQKELSSLQHQIDGMFRIQLQWSVERVPEILRERSGKIRLCISELSGKLTPAI